MEKIFCVAFCGAGGVVVGNHLPALEERSKKYKVMGFFDIVAEKAKELAGTKYKAYSAYEDLLDDSKVDVVVIATKPLSTHFPTARLALEAGKHVVLEKPMASTSQQCDELIALAREKKRVLTVHHNRRLNLDFLALQDVIRQGKIGEPRLIENRVPSNAYGGGDFVDWGVHLVDQSLLLNQSLLQEVSAMFCNPEGAIEDSGYGEVTFRFAEAPLVRLAIVPHPQEFLRNGTPAAVRFYAVGTVGAFVQRVIEDPRDLMNATQNFDKACPEYAVPAYLEIKQKGYYDYVYESLADGAALLVKPEEARNAIRVLELMVESAKANKTVPATGMLEV